MDTYVEFICEINNTQINIFNYQNITFGNVTTNATYDYKYQIEFDGFEGTKIFGVYCSNKKNVIK